MTQQSQLIEAKEIPPRQTMLQMITGFWISQGIYAAAKLGLADLLKDGPKTIDELARTTSASSRELYRLLRFLASLGIFSEDVDGRFSLTPLAATLQTDISGSLGAMAIMYGEEIYQAWGAVLHSIKTGETAFNHVFNKGHFQYLGQNPEAADLFNQAMSEYSNQESKAVISAYDFGRFRKVIDVGGGQGSFLAALLKDYSQINGILFELPQVGESAKRILDSPDIMGRWEVVGGDFLKAIPEGGDAYIIKNIILNWEDEQSISILKNCRKAMADNGKVLVIEAIIPPGNAPSFSKLLDLHMLVVTGGIGRTEKEFHNLFEAAGFKLTSVTPTQSPTSIIEAIPVS